MVGNEATRVEGQKALTCDNPASDHSPRIPQETASAPAQDSKLEVGLCQDTAASVPEEPHYASGLRFWFAILALCLGIFVTTLVRSFSSHII